MKKIDAVQAILKDRINSLPKNTKGKAFAPTNIALCKYWGKRNQELNLPVTSSLSISLGDKGAAAEMILSDTNHDVVTLNNESVDPSAAFCKRLSTYLDLFRTEKNLHFNINIHSTVPIAAGLASSACGFASIVQALDNLFGWDLTKREQSILARIGSGSASRSLWHGFVEWHEGSEEDGSDSFAEPIKAEWHDLRVGLHIMSQKEKPISSREAMQRTVTTSTLYTAWPTQVSKDLLTLKDAIHSKDFELLGQTAEANALAMHATMLSAWPPVTYALPETLIAMQKIWHLRQSGLPVYFTQDAGPNLKFLFLKDNELNLKEYFPTLEIIDQF